MVRNVLENVSMGKTWTTYIGSIDAVLRGAGLWNEDPFLLMGMTGMAFHFIVHETLCPSSVTVYNWAEEHFAMMDRIGIHTDTYHFFNDRPMNTFHQIQADAIRRIKASIDQGKAVVMWAPTPLLEFGVVYGYDDEDRVFFVKDCVNPDPDPLLYENLGRSEVPILSYQIVREKVTVDPEKIYRESLAFGVSEWNKPQHTAPRYASGRKGYENISTALEKGNFNPFGLTYCLHVYADSKNDAAQYLTHVAKTSRRLRGLGEAAEIYQGIAHSLAQLTEAIPFRLPGQVKLDNAQVQEALHVFKGCAVWEDKAMASIAKVLAG